MARVAHGTSRSHARQSRRLRYDDRIFASTVGSEGSALVAAEAPKFGLTVVANESYGSTSTDFTAQIGRIKDSGADSVIVWGAASAPPLAVKQIRDLGLKVNIIGTTGILSQQFLKVAGKEGEGVYSDSPLNYTHPDAPQRAFLRAYEAKFHETPTAFASFAYDAVQLYAYAIKAAGGKTDPDSIVAAWEGMPKRLLLTAGAFQFTPADHNGVRSADVNIAVDKNQVWFNL